MFGTRSLLISATLMLSLIAVPAAPAAVVTGNIFEILDSNGDRIASTVDHWRLSVGSAGIVTFDLLSWERDDEDRFDQDGDFFEPVDVNGDGEIAFVDPVIWLFIDDGSLDVADFVDGNDDDFFSGDGDGSISALDSYLSVALAPGDYILAVGAFQLSVFDAIDQVNEGSTFYPVTVDPAAADPVLNLVPNDHGDYQITFTGNDLTVAGVVPEPSSFALFGLGLASLGLKSLRRRRTSAR